MKTRRVAAVAALLAAVTVPAGVFPQEPSVARDTRTVAVVDGEAITAYEVLEVVRGRAKARSAEPGGLTAPAALEQLIANRLLQLEGFRRGFQSDSEVRQIIESQRERIIIEQYIMWKYRDELALTDDQFNAMREGGVHGASRYSKEQWAGIVQSGRVKEKIEQLENEEGARLPKGAIEYLPSVYEQENTTGRPYRELVVARISGTEVTFGQVVDLLPPKYSHLAPPVRGLEEIKFVRTIGRIAGRLRLAALAKENLESYRAEVDRMVKGYESVLVIRKLVQKEIDPKVTLSEAEERAEYEGNPDKYKGNDGKPLPYEQALPMLRLDLQKAKRKAVTAAFVEELRKKAAITISKEVLNSLGS